MSDPATSGAVSLVVRRTIRAGAELLFAAWTDPVRLRKWWGPGPVTCDAAEIDLRVGGRYRIANRMPDGRILWISGEFERVEPPHRLVYTWRVEPGPETAGAERVTVRFEPRDDATEVIVVHESIPDAETRDRHDAGWHGCLEKLAAFAGD